MAEASPASHEGRAFAVTSSSEHDRRLISTGSPFEEAAAYSRAVVAGDWCFVSGTTGYDYVNALATIGRVLSEAGFELADIVRISYHLTDAIFADRVFPVARDMLGAVRPAATMVVSGLIRPEMKIEIEATALRRSS